MLKFFFINIFILSIPSQSIEVIPRKVPPQGIVLSAKEKDDLTSRLNIFNARLNKIKSPDKAEVEIFHKAASFALKNNEFYKNKKDYQKALRILEYGTLRLKDLEQNKKSWQIKSGKTVRGFRSKIDNSVQPYHLEIPEGLDLSQKVPLIIWLHGRGDKTTDLHFIDQGLNNKLKFPEQKAITIHPFGRQCIGYKSAGEIDVLEAIDHVKKMYNIDETKIALMGFSMGGAGAWHLGAHYAEKWSIVHTGAGFAETKEYTKLKKENYPPWYEEKLWGLYDVPDYARNFLNTPLISYSGENDKQIQAAQVMEKELKLHGMSLNHLIGPKMGHKYAEGYLDKVLAAVSKSFKNKNGQHRLKVNLQTKTLRYPSMHWLKIEGLDEHWLSSQVDAEVTTPMSMKIKTSNISALSLDLPWADKKAYPPGFEITIDGQPIKLSKSHKKLLLQKKADWQIIDQLPTELRKSPFLQGPIDDAFMAPFLVIAPSHKSLHKAIDEWTSFEIAHLKKRWQELFRGNIRLKKDTEVTVDDIKNYNLILWGTPESNSFIKRIIDKTPIKWSKNTLQLNDKKYPVANHLPAFIYPNPENPNKYIVINSGPTFRENHDRTNSLQNPKLPDWVVFDISQHPNGDTAGKVIDAHFFNESWQFKK